MGNEKTEERHSFIAGARRAQIINAAIQTLDEIGYAKASLAQIAKRADFSTALISYHFKDKEDLMNHTLMTLLETNAAFVLAQTQGAPDWRARLRAFILASLEYQSTHRAHYHALVEIVFTARTPENVPYYRLGDDEEEPLLLELQNVLAGGQQAGEFRAFHVGVMAKAIQGAIGEYMGNPNTAHQIDAAAYGEELVGIFECAILAEPH